MRTPLSIVVLCLLSVVPQVFASLSPEAAAFAKGPAQYLMTKDEKKQWERIGTDDEAKKFVELFWARRDPTPGTPVNEYRDLVDDRIKAADGRFAEAKIAGSATDRGKVFILMGSPTKIRRAGQQGASTIQSNSGGFRPSSDTTAQPYSLKELWQYEQGQVSLKLGQPMVEVAFIDQYGANEWRIERVLRTDYTSVFDRVARSFIAQPNLTEAPVYAAAAAAEPAMTTVAPPATIATEALRIAVDEARARKAVSDTLFLSYGEFVTPTGEHYVPVQLYVPKSAGLVPDTKVTLFGAIDREEGGERVAVFEEPITLAATKEGVFYARSLTLPPGKYVGTFGLARDGKPLSVLSRPIALQGLDHTAPSISSLILTDNVYPLSAAQEPTDPFAFGGLKVVPKGDAVFNRGGDIGYFFEIRNPALDPATNQPKIALRVMLSGTTNEGKAVKIIGPSEAVEVQPLKDVPGHFAIGQAMPLSTFKPGSYTLTLKVTDTTSGKTYDIQESFRIVE